MPPTKSQAGSSDHRRPSSKEPEEGEPSDTLYAGGISSDTVDLDLMALFGEHGALDCVTMHGGAKSYAFIYFRNIAEARVALEAVQGAQLHGSPIRIEFARPAKPYKHLWVGGISSSITKEQLEDEFLKFGKIEEYNFFRDRNSALIYYYKTDDAIAAQKNLNGKLLVDELIRVDFQRPPPLKREWPDHHNLRDGRFSNRRSMGLPEPWMPPDGMRGFHDAHHGPKRHLPYGGRKGEGLPSNVLWIGYPPSVCIDEQMLHNAMILFGEIERIKCFPSRNYSFIEFRSVDEARRAKEGLQGRLFNDPRIQILFSSSELAPNKDSAPLLPGFRGPRPDAFFNEPPFGPPEFLGPGNPMAPNNFPGLPPPNGMPRPSMLARPFESKGFELSHGASSEFHDFGDGGHSFSDGISNPHWKRRSPATGILPSGPGMHTPFRPMPGGWDGFDTREMKRSRVDGTPPLDDTLLHGRRIGGEGLREPFGFSHDGGGPGQSHYSPAVRDGGMHGPPSYDHFWRGVIAKGGTHVCRARCVPIGKGIDSPFPEVVNCSARTGLDMLTKHYAEASGFDIVFFLPDSEEDFASYTDFLRYLGLKNRAGVAKLDDGTTLFLVPPSDFLTKVLNVSGPERLYGVVLKLQESINATAQLPQVAIPPHPPNYVDRQQVPSLQKGFSFVPQNEEQMDYGRSLHEELMPHPGVGKPLLAHVEESHATHSSYAAATSKVEVSLTPELLATLASLLPSSAQSTTNETAQISSTTSTRSVSASVMHERSMSLQGWGQEHQSTLSSTTLEQPNHPPQQLGHQFNSLGLLGSQFAAYANTPGGPDYSAQPVVSGTQIQESLNISQGAAVSIRPSNNYVAPSQIGQFLAPQSSQPYQLDSSYGSYDNYGMSQATDAAIVFNPSLPQQPNPTAASTGHGQIGNLPQAQIPIPLATEKVNTEFPSQVQQLQSLLSSSGQGSSEGDADKKQRYQSTLQFAASLLLQIQQQQQQQASAQAAQGSGNQQ